MAAGSKRSPKLAAFMADYAKNPSSKLVPFVKELSARLGIDPLDPLFDMPEDCPVLKLPNESAPPEEWRPVVRQVLDTGPLRGIAACPRDWGILIQGSYGAVWLRAVDVNRGGSRVFRLLSRRLQKGKQHDH